MIALSLTMIILKHIFDFSQGDSIQHESRYRHSEPGRSVCCYQG